MVGRKVHSSAESKTEGPTAGHRGWLLVRVALEWRMKVEGIPRQKGGDGMCMIKVLMHRWTCGASVMNQAHCS